jgi:hypothetical protein
MKKVEKEFELVRRIIERHWERAIGLVNAESLMTYWTVGAFVSERLKNAQWGSKTVEELSDYLKTRNPKRRGFGKRHIYNMVSFYDTYTSPEFQSISERLRLHEFVQLPTAQIDDGAVVQLPIAQIDRTMSPMMIAEYKRLLVPEAVMKKSLEEYCAFMK